MSGSGSLWEPAILVALTLVRLGDSAIPVTTGERLTHQAKRSLSEIDHLERHGASGQLLRARCNRCQCRSCLLQCFKSGCLSRCVVYGLSSEWSFRAV